MPRKPRIHYPGALYHVMLRGNGGCHVFAHDRDRYRFFLLLQEAVERFDCRVFAYCLMDNHIHLALQVGGVPLAKVMQNLSSRFTRWVNWCQQKTGHLFQGRYKAILIEEDAYLLQLVAYLHLNPVRAHMVDGLVEYRWSSHRAYLGLETLPWLSCDLVLQQFSPNLSKARSSFANFVSEEAGKGHRCEFHGRGKLDPRVCGEEGYVSEILGLVRDERIRRPDLFDTVQCVADHFGCTIGMLKTPGQKRSLSEVRAFAAWAVVEYSSSSLTALGVLLSRDISTLSSAVRRLEEKVRGNEGLAHTRSELSAKLANLQA